MGILILGARGMLGGALCDVFQDQHPVCWDQDDVDITDASALRSAVTALRPSQSSGRRKSARDADDFVIINAAAYTDVDGAEEHRELAFAANEHGVANVVQAAQDVGAQVVHYSTDYVFPGDRDTGYVEDDEPGPAVNVYGESKLAGERVLHDSGVSYRLLRTAWLYGAGGSNFVDTMLELGQKGEPLPVVNDQYGTPTFVRDVARATRELLEGPYHPGVYHVVNAGLASWYEFAVAIFKAADISVELTPVSSESFPRPARRPRYSVLRNTRGPHLRDWRLALSEYLSERF